MAEAGQQDQLAATESAVPQSETVASEQQAPVASDTTETAQETDEQKNERELAEQRDRSEKKARGVQKRLDELTADKYAEREARIRAEQRADELLKRLDGPKQPVETDAEPKRTDFTEYEDWVAAKAEHRARKAAQTLIDERVKAETSKRAQEQQQRQFTEVRQQFETRQREFAKQAADYFDVVNTEDVRIPDAAGAALHLMDDGPALVYYLAKNPEVAQSLWGKSPPQQLVALGQISAKLSSPPQVSKAPAPGKPVGARAGDSTNPPADPDGYRRWREKQRG